MADPTEKEGELAIVEAQDGSATVEIPEGMMNFEGEEGTPPQNNSQQDDKDDHHADQDDPNDDDELRQAKRNRRRAKKDLIRKTNQEKDVRLVSLQRENEEFRRRLSQLERNTKAENVTRIDKGIEDAQVQLEYAKMKLAEATQNNDGQAMVEAQTLWHNANDQVKKLQGQKDQATRDLNTQQQEYTPPNPVIQRNAAQWMRKNGWYNPATNDPDSRIAKSIDEKLVSEGWDPEDPDYWDELDSRLQRILPHRYNDINDDDSRQVRRPRNVVGSSGREASAAYGGTNRNQFVLDPDRVKAMKEAGAWENPERKARMIKEFIAYDRINGRNRNN